MAKNFLVLSKTYRNETSEEERIIDGVVAGYLSDTYRLLRGESKILKVVLTELGYDLTPAQMSARIRRFSLAYSLMKGVKSRHATDMRCAERPHFISAPYRALRADGITTWNQVCELLESQDASQAQVETGHETASQAEVRGSGPLPAQSPMKGYVLVVKSELDALIAEQVTLRREVKELSERLMALEERQTALEPVAVDLVSVPALVEAAETTEAAPVQVTKPTLPPKAEVKVTAPATPVVEDICSKLPKTSSYRGVTRSVRYAKAFLGRFKRMDPFAQSQIIKAVTAIAENKVSGGLQVKPLTPPNLAREYSRDAVYSARASKKLRLSFEPSRMELVFHDLLSKGQMKKTSEF